MGGSFSCADAEKAIVRIEKIAGTKTENGFFKTLLLG